METDRELLERWARGREAGEGAQAEGAFAELVRRHVGMVHGVARRMLGGPGREAEDVVQGVFWLLAQRAGRGRVKGEKLGGWLYRVTVYACRAVRKGEGRRKKREREVGMLRGEAAALEEGMREEVVRVLDEGMMRLTERERRAVVARYLEGKSAEEAGVELGVSASAAEKRARRGVERLRRFFGKRGMRVGVGAVVGVMGIEAAKAAPVGVVEGAVRAGSGAVSVVGMALAKGAAMAMVRVMVMRGAVGIGLVGVGAGLVAADLSRSAAAGGVSRDAAATAPSTVDARGLELLVQLVKVRGETISRVAFGHGAGTSRYDREGVLPEVFSEQLPSHAVEFEFRGEDYLVKEFDSTDPKRVTASFLREGSKDVRYAAQKSLQPGQVYIENVEAEGEGDVKPAGWSWRALTKLPLVKDEARFFAGVKRGVAKTTVEQTDDGVLTLVLQYPPPDPGGFYERSYIFDMKAGGMLKSFSFRHKSKFPALGDVVQDTTQRGTYTWVAAGQGFRPARVESSVVMLLDGKPAQRATSVLDISVWDEQNVPASALAMTEMGIASGTRVRDELLNTRWNYSDNGAEERGPQNTSQPAANP